MSFESPFRHEAVEPSKKKKISELTSGDTFAIYGGTAEVIRVEKLSTGEIAVHIKDSAPLRYEREDANEEVELL